MLLSIPAPKYRNNVKAFEHLTFCLIRFQHRSLNFWGNFNPGPKLVSSAPVFANTCDTSEHTNEDETRFKGLICGCPDYGNDGQVPK